MAKATLLLWLMLGWVEALELPAIENEGNCNRTQYLRVETLGKVLLNENSAKLITGYDLASLFQAVFIAQHQSRLVAKIFKDARNSSMLEFDPFPKSGL